AKLDGVVAAFKEIECAKTLTESVDERIGLRFRRHPEDAIDSVLLCSHWRRQAHRSGHRSNELPSVHGSLPERNLARLAPDSAARCSAGSEGNAPFRRGFQALWTARFPTPMTRRESPKLL